MLVLKKKYNGESIVDMYRDVSECIEEDFNPLIEIIPKDQYNIQLGTFTVSVEWSPDPYGEIALVEVTPETREVLMDTLASLVAAVSLLEGGGKKAAASDKMFDQMVIDYNKTIEKARKFIKDNNI
jgi:hypothetical protein